MHYKTRGKGTEPRLETFRNDGKKAHSVFYADFEEMFLKFLDQLDWTEVLDIAESEDLKRAEDALASLDFDIARAEQQGGEDSYFVNQHAVYDTAKAVVD